MGGTIFLETPPLDATATSAPVLCNALTPASVSFQEYYTGGTFYAGAAWIGPSVDGWDEGGSAALFEALDADADCVQGHIDKCIPSAEGHSSCGRPNAFFEQGAAVVPNCSKH